jgi:hypothetical protein
MVLWHRSWQADVGLRLVGLVSCGVAYAALSHLFSVPLTARAPAPLTYALAAIGFVLASAGTALICLGHHLFDRIEVSSRWRRGSGSDAPFRTDLVPAQSASDDRGQRHDRAQASGVAERRCVHGLSPDLYAHSATDVVFSGRSKR